MPTTYFDPYAGLPASDELVSTSTPGVPNPLWFLPSPLTVDNNWQGAQTFGGPVTFAGGVIGAGAGGGPVLGVAATVTAAGPLVVNKHNPVDATSAPLTMTLPTGQPQGSIIIAEKYDSTTNAVTVSGSIRGVPASTDVLVLPHQTTMFEADAAGSWWPVSSHKALATLDGRYASDTLAVHKAGAETVTGIKTFTQTNFFTANQQLQAGDGSSQVNGPELHFIGTNGAWGGPAIDIAAAIPSRDFVLAFKYPVTWTALDGACASGSTAFSSASAAFVGGTNNGQRIQGNNIPADTFVTVVDATHLTLSKPTTGVVSGYYSLGAPGGAIDFVYLSHGGTHAPTFGIGKAQPDLTYRAVVMGPADGVLDTAMGGFRVVNGNACTGDAFHVENWGGGTLFSVSSGGATLVTVPIALAHALQVISGASTTMLNLDTTGSGAFIVPVQVSGFGLGSTGTPTATIDAVSTTTNNATLKVRTASWGSFQIIANGTTPGDVTLGTANGTALKLQSNAATRITLTPAGSVVIGTAALANATTDGFLYIPTVAGAPTGVPTAQTGTVPLAYDVTNDMFYIYRGGWKKTTVFA